MRLYAASGHFHLYLSNGYSAALVGIALRYWFEDLRYCIQTKDYGGALADIGMCICLIALGILLALIWDNINLWNDL